MFKYSFNLYFFGKITADGHLKCPFICHDITKSSAVFVHSDNRTVEKNSFFPVIKVIDWLKSLPKIHKLFYFIHRKQNGTFSYLSTKNRSFGHWNESKSIEHKSFASLFGVQREHKFWLHFSNLWSWTFSGIRRKYLHCIGKYHACNRFHEYTFQNGKILWNFNESWTNS